MKELELLKEDYNKRQKIKNEKLKPLKNIFRSCNHCEFRERDLPLDNCLVKNRNILAFEVINSSLLILRIGNSSNNNFQPFFLQICFFCKFC